MDILPFAHDPVRPVITIVAHMDGITAISRRWESGVLDADPCCRGCPTRGPVTCLAMVRLEGLDGEKAVRFDECKDACRPARGGEPASRRSRGAR